MGESRRVSPEVHNHLHCFERVELQVVKTAPDNQLLRFVTVLNEADKCGFICKFQELDRPIIIIIICYIYIALFLGIIVI